MAPSLDEELRLVAVAAAGHASGAEQLAGVMPAEAKGTGRLFLCAYAEGDELRWLLIDRAGEVVVDAALVREFAALVAICELAEENAGGGDVAGLRRRLAELRETEQPEGIEEAEEAAALLEQAIEPEPRIARAEYLDALGEAAMRLERTLGETTSSPFTAAMQAGMAIVDEVARDVVEHYKATLES